jgi:5-methylcytosine rRNA methyltransferase NSUN4
MKGEEAFDHFFSNVYSNRWLAIKKALLEDDKKIARLNLFQKNKEEIEKCLGIGDAVKGLKNAYDIDESFDLAKIETTLLPFYRMDPASLFPAIALKVKSSDIVLDMCAAPGGKSLILIEDLVNANSEEPFDLSGSLVANEISPKRRHRMMSVFKRYLPKEVRQIVKIKGMDGSRIGLERKEYFDKILLDAPCSGERGLLHKKVELDLWKEKRSKSFGIRQYSLLASAFMSLKKGGRIVYSTCSISPHENDNVIAKLMKRRKDEFNIIFDQDQFGERTQWGTQFLPDQNGWGPIFYSIIEKH